MSLRANEESEAISPPNPAVSGIKALDILKGIASSPPHRMPGLLAMTILFGGSAAQDYQL
jgi:hypothetical protein